MYLNISYNSIEIIYAYIKIILLRKSDYVHLCNWFIKSMWFPWYLSNEFRFTNIVRHFCFTDIRAFFFCNFDRLLYSREINLSLIDTLAHLHVHKDGQFQTKQIKFKVLLTSGYGQSNFCTDFANFAVEHMYVSNCLYASNYNTCFR